jgi:hypothetical protein
MNTYVIVLNNGKQVIIQADGYEKNDQRVLFQTNKGVWVGIFMNDNIAGFYRKDYEAQ